MMLKLSGTGFALVLSVCLEPDEAQPWRPQSVVCPLYAVESEVAKSRTRGMYPWSRITASLRHVPRRSIGPTQNYLCDDCGAHERALTGEESWGGLGSLDLIRLKLSWRGVRCDLLRPNVSLSG